MSHLSAVDRNSIESYLNMKYSLRQLADFLQKSPSTISREIKNHTQHSTLYHCNCLNLKTCNYKHVCNHSPANPCNKECRNCGKAQKFCPDFVKLYCDELADSNRTLCNGCKKLHTRCTYQKNYYDATKAQSEYENTLRSSRNGVNLSYEQICSLNDTVSPLIRKGQSVYHIVQTNDICVSESTLRRMIDKGEFDAGNIDLRDKIKRKQRRKNTNNNYKRMAVIKDGHKYEDYLRYIDEHDVPTVQMDCVIGKKDEPEAILSLQFPEFCMQLYFIMPVHNSTYVVATLDMIEETLGKELFDECFPLILTDNGQEFSNIDDIERSIYGGKRTIVFFCEPNRSDEKGSCENNHKLLRYIIPKGTSIHEYTQADMCKCTDNINSYTRKRLHGKSPFEAAMSVMPVNFFALLGCTVIPPKEIKLTPSLIKKSNLSK